MSYEYNREAEHGGEGGNRGSHRESRHHGHHQDDNEGKRYNDIDEYPSNQSRREDGNVATGGYGREAERPMHGYSTGRDGEETGGYSAEARHNLQSQGFERRRNEYEGQGQGRRGGDGGYDQNENRSHNQDSGGYGGGGGGGRSAIGSGETYVGLDGTGESQRRTTDAYSGESASYSSNIQGGYGSMGSDQSSRTTTAYVVGSGEKWKPGQEMHFPAAEAESKKNPYAPVAQQLADETQDVVKAGVKNLETWAETKAKELFGSGK